MTKNIEKTLEEELKEITKKVTGSVLADNKPLLLAAEMESSTRHRYQEELGDTVFIPTQEQIDFVRFAFHPKAGELVEEWIDFATKRNSHITQENVTEWMADQQFIDWLKVESDRRASFYRLEWLKTGILKMRNDIQTWANMGKYFYPKGLETSSNEKGSERASLEKEFRDIVKKKNKSDS